MTRLRSLIKEILSSPKKKDCGCGCNKCGDKAPILTEGKFKSLISEGLQHHIDKKISLFESVYRIGSDKHLSLIREARALWIRGIIEVSDDDKGLLETHLGHFGLYEGVEVPLDLPMLNEEESNMPSQEEVDKFFSITQNEMHYLNSKPVMGQEGDRFRREIEPWDEYDLSNWNALVRKKESGRPPFGESLLGKMGDSIKKGLKSLSLNPIKQAKLSSKMFKNLYRAPSVYRGVFQAIEFKRGEDKDGNVTQTPRTSEESKKYYISIFKKSPDLAKKLAKIDPALRGWYKDVSGEEIKESLDENNLLKQAKLSSEEYQKAKKLKDFNKDDYEWNSTESLNVKEKKSKFKKHGEMSGFDMRGIDEEMVDYDFSKGELIRVIKQLKSGASGEIGMIKAFEKALGRELTDDEIRGFKIDPSKVGRASLEERIVNILEAKVKKKDNRPIGKPMRDTSGGKAYKVYVKDPKTKKVKTVRFGSGGLRAKINDSKARAAFAARHKCSTKKDRTKAGYWSCRLPRYAKLLGLKSSFSGFW